MPCLTPATLLAALCWILPHAGDAEIIRRHDRDDARYLELGQKFPVVGTFVPQGDGVVTLVGDRWCLTAAHVAEILSPFRPVVRFGEQEVVVRNIYFHPSWNGEAGPESADMALLELESAVEGIEPALLYRGDDEVGKVITFVGWGDVGTGLTGPTGADGKKRGATNTVLAATEKWVTFRFDAPPDGTELEGISGPGDSGGPALLEQDGKIYTLGVGSGNDDAEAGGLCQYDSIEYYARVSTAQQWLDAVMAGEVAEKHSVPTARPLASTGWPAGSASALSQAFFAAYPDPEKLAEFETAHRSKEALERKSVEARVARWKELYADWGALKPAVVAVPGDDALLVLVHAENGDRWFNIRFQLSRVDPPQLDFLAIGRDSPPR